jgi:hypothetical protein
MLRPQSFCGPSRFEEVPVHPFRFTVRLIQSVRWLESKGIGATDDLPRMIVEFTSRQHEGIAELVPLGTLPTATVAGRVNCRLVSGTQPAGARQSAVLQESFDTRVDPRNSA